MQIFIMLFIAGVIVYNWSRIIKAYAKLKLAVSKFKLAHKLCDFFDTEELSVNELRAWCLSLESRESELKKQSIKVQALRDELDDMGEVDIVIDYGEIRCIERIDVGTDKEHTIVGYRKSGSTEEGWKEWFLFITRDAHNRLCKEFNEFKKGA